jgi:translocation and assembly module TamB
MSDGTVDIQLQGATARIERFTARGGTGSLQLQGQAQLDGTPQAQLKLSLDHFQLLGRVDRKLVGSGQATLNLTPDLTTVTGELMIDEGLVDFSQGDAPRLAEDVQVLRAQPSRSASAPSRRVAKVPTRQPPVIQVTVNLGEKLHLRGRGLETRLHGNLQLTTTEGALQVNGKVNAEEGTYRAYAQKLNIDRGVVSFNGDASNPRLDIEATRPNTDIRVGVTITGSAKAPRVRLFSEPDMLDADKLSWLLLGRGSDGLASTDISLLQSAALALLSGEEEGVSDQLMKAIGIDDLSIRQSDGAVKETVVSLGKQLSRRWYVGYERGLNATEGSWQLIYRMAQRFTLRAQTGHENSVDLIWTWRWQ